MADSPLDEKFAEMPRIIDAGASLEAIARAVGNSDLPEGHFLRDLAQKIENGDLAGIPVGEFLYHVRELHEDGQISGMMLEQNIADAGTQYPIPARGTFDAQPDVIMSALSGAFSEATQESWNQNSPGLAPIDNMDTNEPPGNSDDAARHAAEPPAGIADDMDAVDRLIGVPNDPSW